jgi:hypothetical protein
MANLELTTDERSELLELVERVYPRPAVFAQFLMSKLCIDYHQYHADRYQDVLLLIQQDLESNGRVREFVRKLRFAKEDDTRVQAFLAKKLPADREWFVAILERGQFGWDRLVKLVEQEASAVEIPVQWRRALPAAREEALYVYARRCGDLVDALATASTNSDQPPVIVRFARRLIQEVQSAELSDDMRRWIDATRPHSDVRYDAAFIYLAEDAQMVNDLVARLTAANVRVFPRSWQSVPVDAWKTILEEARRELGRTAVCVSEATAASWPSDDPASLSPELEAARGAVFPILLRVARERVRLPSFLQPSTWVEFRSSLDDETALMALRDRISPETSINRPDQVTRRPTSPLIDEAGRKLARWLINQEVVFILGPATARPSLYSVSRTLLRKIGLALTERAWIPPIDVAGMYYAIQNTDPELQKAVRQELTAASELPATHQAIARVVKRAIERRVRPRTQDVNRRPLIVTTNHDVMLERALLLAGMSFTRVVQYRSGKSDGSPLPPVGVTEFRIRQLRDSLVQLEGGQQASFDVGSTDWHAADAAIQELTVADVSIDKLTFEGNPDHPILYKFHGSEDVDESCAISTDHYDLFELQAVPPFITGRVTTKPLLLLGYYWTDPAMRHLRRTLFRNLVRGNTDRFAVQYPLPVDPDALYQMEKALSASLIVRWGQLSMQALECEGVTLLEEIERRLGGDELRRSA